MTHAERILDWDFTMYLLASPFKGNRVHCSLKREKGNGVHRIEWDDATYENGRKTAFRYASNGGGWIGVSSV